MSPLEISELWRYPVKSLGGERLETAELAEDGVVGDRIVQVHGPEGVRTSRRHSKLLGLHGSLGDDGAPTVDGFPWRSDEAAALVRAAAGDDAHSSPMTGSNGSTSSRCSSRPMVRSPRSAATAGASDRTS